MGIKIIVLLLISVYFTSAWEAEVLPREDEDLCKLCTKLNLLFYTRRGFGAGCLPIPVRAKFIFNHYVVHKGK